MGSYMKKWEKDMVADCLVSVFQRLNLEDLTLSVPLVCKLWHRASLDPLCWQILNLEKLDFMPGSQFVKKFEANCVLSSFTFTGFLKLVVAHSYGLAVELRFPRQCRASIDDLVFVSNECPRLKLLALPNLAPKDELLVPQLVGNWKDLERLEMELKPLAFPELMAQIGTNCEKFKGLKMSGSIKKKDALAMVNHTPSLKYLDLSRSYLRKEELILIMKGCKKINRLKVNGCIGFQADKDVLEMASSITEFEHEGSKLPEYYVYDIFNWDQLFFSIMLE